MLKSGREFYLRLFRYYYSLKHFGFANICRQIVLLLKHKFQAISDGTAEFQLKQTYSEFQLMLPSERLLEKICHFFSQYVSLSDSNQPSAEKLEHLLKKTSSKAIQQINQQFLLDGAYFSRIPAQHIKILKQLESLKSLASNLASKSFLSSASTNRLITLSQNCGKKIAKGKSWLELLTLSDGFIAQFGDSYKLPGMAQSFTTNSKLLENSGFFIHHQNNNSFILNCGEPAPAFAPECSHCDMLSYELSVKNYRCIVDTGYTATSDSSLRQSYRKTSAHNLPMVQHEEQSDIWGSFYMGKRAKILKRAYNSSCHKLEILIEDQFGQKVQRIVNFLNNQIEIKDSLENRRMNGTFITLIHLAPQTEIKLYRSKSSHNIAECVIQKQVRLFITTENNIRIDDYLSFTDSNQSVPAKVLILSQKETQSLAYKISIDSSFVSNLKLPIVGSKNNFSN